MMKIVMSLGLLLCFSLFQVDVQSFFCSYYANPALVRLLHCQVLDKNFYFNSVEGTSQSETH